MRADSSLIEGTQMLWNICDSKMTGTMGRSLRLNDRWMQNGFFLQEEEHAANPMLVLDGVASNTRRRRLQKLNH